MDSFAAVLVDRGLLTLDDLEFVTSLQLLHGGDLASNILAAGVVKENALQRVLADYFELPAGPTGPLEPMPSEVADLVPQEVLQRLRVFPLKRSTRTLMVAVDRSPSATGEQELRALVALQLRPMIVSSVRLSEALCRASGKSPALALGRLLTALGERAPQPRAAGVREATGYRRMSERPEGVRVSQKQLGGGHVETLTKPELSEAPAPDSQGRWLDHLVNARANVEPVSVPPLDEHRELRFDTSSPRPPLWPPSSAAPESDVVSAHATSLPAVARPRVPNAVFPPPSGRAGSHEVASLGRASVAVRQDVFARSEVPPSPLVAFRHRGPLDAATALDLVRQAQDVEVILKIVARFSQQFFERMLIFAVDGEVAEMRLSYGLTAEPPRLLVELSQPGLLRRALLATAPIVGALAHAAADGAVRSALGVGPASPEAAVVPMAIRGRVVLLVYGDDRDEPVTAAAVAAVHALCQVAGGEMARVVLHANSS